MSIELQSRKRFAELIRQLASGRLTNDEFQDASGLLARDSNDPAIHELRREMWVTYSDLYEHRLIGRHKLSRADRHVVVRMVVFLHSDLPYEWPLKAQTGCLLGLMRRVRPVASHGTARSGEAGDQCVWPFFRSEDLATAAARPTLLGRPS
jgi:hypothetical protein